MSKLTLTGLFAAAGLALLATSCGVGGSSPSGFLADYGQLGSGYDPAGGVAAYAKPGADFKDYDTIIFDPVTTIVDAEKVDPQVAEQLAAYLQRSLSAELGMELRLVGEPGPRTLRVRTALTDIVSGVPATSPVTTVHPKPKAVLSGTLGAEAAAFVASVSFEGEIVESMTGERLTALTDQRIGAKREASAKDDWTYVRSMVEVGSKSLADRLKVAQAR